MKKLFLGAAAATLLFVSPVSAQYAEFGFGPGGPSVHVGPGYGYHSYGPGYGPRAYYRDRYVVRREYPMSRRHFRSYDWD